MAVTSQLTSIEDFASPTYVNYGGGPAASDNTDIFIEGAQSGGRRVDSASDKGFGASISPTVDLSAVGVHVKLWLWVTQWNSVTQVQIRLADATNDDDHEWPTSAFPLPIGGFFPVWIDVSRAPEVGGSANEAAITEIGVLLDIANIGGTSPNLIIDEIMHGTSGLLWDGTGGDMGDFRTYEDTNAEGVLLTIQGVDYCLARLKIGSATATGFTDSGFTLVFPDQPLIAPTFMGMTFDLQNASTAISVSGATIQSSDPVAATNRPDFLVTGTSGTLTLTNVTLAGFRLMNLTEAVTLTNVSYADGGQIDLGGQPTIDGLTVRDPTDDGAMLVNAANEMANVKNVTFDGAGIGGASTDAAIEIDISGAGPHTINLDNVKFQNRIAGSVDLHFLDQGGDRTYTINILNGGDTPTFTKDRGTDTVTIVNSVTATVTVKDAAGVAIQSARVSIRKDSDNSEILGGLTNASGIVTGSVDASVGAVNVRVRKGSGSGTDYVPVRTPGTIGATNFDVTISMVEDTINAT